MTGVRGEGEFWNKMKDHTTYANAVRSISHTKHQPHSVTGVPCVTGEWETEVQLCCGETSLCPLYETLFQ